MADLNEISLTETSVFLSHPLSESPPKKPKVVKLLHIDDPGSSQYSLKKKQCDLWEYVWSSSLILCKCAIFSSDLRHICSKATILARVDMRSLSILEVGCGNGLNSIVAAQSGGFVTATDLVQDAVTLTKWSARLNAVLTSMEFRTLSWNDIGSVPKARFDVVLATDCLFFSGAINPVADTMLKALKTGGIGITVDLFHLHAMEFAMRLHESGMPVEVFHFDPAYLNYPAYSSKAFLKMKSAKLVVFSNTHGDLSERMRVLKKDVMEQVASFHMKMLDLNEY